jgi:hypothetical protein
LKRGGLPRIIRTNEHDRLAKLDLGLVESLEVSDRQFGQHKAMSVE